MDLKDRNFVRLYKMVTDVGRDVLWETLLCTIRPPSTVMELVKDASERKSSYQTVYKELLSSWKEMETVTPIHTDFDVGSLYVLLDLIWKKKEKRSPYWEAIKFIKKRRNELAHLRSPITTEIYNEDYITIRSHVDNLEQNICTHTSNNRFLRSGSSRYLNMIERIHSDYVDSEIIKDMIKECRKELRSASVKFAKREDENEKDENENADLELEDIVLETPAAYDNNDSKESTSLQFDKPSLDETMQEVERTLKAAKENKEDLESKMMKQDENVVKQDEKIIEQQEQLVELKEKTIQQKEIITKQEEKLVEHKEKIVKQEEKLAKQEEKIIQQEEKIIQQEENINKLSEDLSSQVSKNEDMEGHQIVPEERNIESTARSQETEEQNLEKEREKYSDAVQRVEYDTHNQIERERGILELKIYEINHKHDADLQELHNVWEKDVSDISKMKKQDIEQIELESDAKIKGIKSRSDFGSETAFGEQNETLQNKKEQIDDVNIKYQLRLFDLDIALDEHRTELRRNADNETKEKNQEFEAVVSALNENLEKAKSKIAFQKKD